MSIPHSEAIVLKSFDFRETSRIATFFTREYGKIKGVLKGIRKDHRKFGSNIDRFSINDIVYYHYRRSDIHLISQCDLKSFFFPIREDYRRNVAANYVLELVDAVMPPEEPNREVYQLLLDYLNSLQRTADIDKIVHVFQIKILVLSGFRPHIDSCVRCGKQIKGKARFSMKSGGLVCSDCPAAAASLTIVSKGTVATLLHIERSSWDQCLRLGLTKTVRRELKYILNNFLVYHLERQLKSARFLNASP